MKRIIVVIALVLGALATAAPAGAVTDNGTGHFWLFSGANGTGQWRDYNIGPSQSYRLIGFRYSGGCPVNGCGYIDNTVSSVMFSCGTSGSAIDQSDYLKFYLGDAGVGTAYYYNPDYPAACSNGRIIMNLVAPIDNAASSVVTVE